MKTALVTCNWSLDANDNQVPQLYIDYPGASFVDYTGSRVSLPDTPDPALVTLVVQCDDTTATQIMDNTEYVVETTDERGAASFLDVPESTHYQGVIGTWLSQ